MLNSGSNYKNLIFDLGGVLLNLSLQRTFDAFARLANISPDTVSKTYHQHPEFIAFERGELTDAEFRAALRKLLSITATDSELDACWNAMLVDIPMERLQLLEKLRNRFQLFLLSNTNSIHERHFNRIVNRNTGHSSLEPFFHKAYFSHAVKMRKPDREIYEYVLSESNIIAFETLFLDDSLMNLEGAQQLGIKTYHVHHPDHILSLFSETPA